MKKKLFYMGICYLLAGIIFLLCGIFLDTKINSLFWGFAGAFMVPGLVMTCKYFYWSRPKYSEIYQERIENEKIELHDERKEMLRNKTGRILFLLNLPIISIAIVILSLLEQLELIDFAKPVIISLAALWILQLILYYMVYKILEKRN